MFELETPTAAKMLDVIVLSQKNRQPEDDPGAKMFFEVALSNDAMAYFDGHLKAFCFTSEDGAGGDDDAQEDLDGMAVSDAPNLTPIGQHVGVLRWDQELTGYELLVNHPIMNGKPLAIADCALSHFRMRLKQGGTFLVKFNCESTDVSEKAFGKLAKLKSREVNVMLRPTQTGRHDEVAWPFAKDGKTLLEAPPQSVTVEAPAKGSRRAPKAPARPGKAMSKPKATRAPKGRAKADPDATAAFVAAHGTH